ncbi:MAG TPA: hypothetical protein VEW03_14365 [Longimicrobiaceae bacterium]|nr:hypothetical protein [Longimicrobiaceae bacterium]
MPLWFPLVLLLLAAAASLAAMRYLAHLPDAPDCPRCRAVTGQAYVAGPIDRLCSRLAATPLRLCPRCRWVGRMRWRLAGERVPRDPGGERRRG